MFIEIAAAAAVLATVIEICFLSKQTSMWDKVHIIVRNLAAITTGAIAVQKYIMKYGHFLDNGSYGKRDIISFSVAALAFAAVFEAAVYFVTHSRLFEKCKEPKRKALTAVIKILAVIIFFTGAAAFFGTLWGGNQFGFVTGDQLLINLISPTEGTETGIYIDGFENGVFPTVLLTVYFIIILYSKYIFNTKKKRTDFLKRTICLILALCFAAGGVLYGSYKFRLDKVINAYVMKSDIIDANYADPETVNVQFPEKKRNLIHIYLESVENSYLSKEYGGNIDVNLMPNLTELAKSGVVFSDTDNFFGGPLQGTGTQWSVASMVNQTTGLPMKAPGILNAYGVEGNFLPGAYTLGELLEREGYEQSMMIGSSAVFGGLKYYYQTHGNWKVMDYEYALENGMIPKDYKVWWGYEDDKLYEFAKEEITRLYNTGKPFNFTVENADTHKPDGYITPGKETPFESHYANAIWNCDRDVSEFIKWIQSQPFYENTTIVLIGDHLSMDYRFFNEDYDFSNYKRTQFNAIINADPSVASPDEAVTRNRKWANWDMFPTIIASVGGKIEGERLGIGTNLFSGKKTVYEEYGVEKVDYELEKGSELYNEKILGGDKAKTGVRARNYGGGNN